MIKKLFPVLIFVFLCSGVSHAQPSQVNAAPPAGDSLSAGSNATSGSEQTGSAVDAGKFELKNSAHKFHPAVLLKNIGKKKLPADPTSSVLLLLVGVVTAMLIISILGRRFTLRKPK